MRMTTNFSREKKKSKNKNKKDKVDIGTAGWFILCHTLRNPPPNIKKRICTVRLCVSWQVKNKYKNILLLINIESTLVYIL